MNDFTEVTSGYVSHLIMNAPSKGSDVDPHPAWLLTKVKSTEIEQK